ncbi:hypothetical protein SBRY_11071 [Actinacidiphila bryophytorum]|uniref:Uncharacterized protein n=1 Tax=Actinacidiphila bryophytorum TaxID=1436133 RepID=A0A9W4GXF8_9ACTN|nr:hypothetical protein SBRY_11071 [Actinacidiphila bryophytorum]
MRRPRQRGRRLPARQGPRGRHRDDRGRPARHGDPGRGQGRCRPRRHGQGHRGRRHPRRRDRHPQGQGVGRRRPRTGDRHPRPGGRHLDLGPHHDARHLLHRHRHRGRRVGREVHDHQHLHDRSRGRGQRRHPDPAQQRRRRRRPAGLAGLRRPRHRPGRRREGAHADHHPRGQGQLGLAHRPADRGPAGRLAPRRLLADRHPGHADGEAERYRHRRRALPAPRHPRHLPHRHRPHLVRRPGRAHPARHRERPHREDLQDLRGQRRLPHLEREDGRDDQAVQGPHDVGLGRHRHRQGRRRLLRRGRQQRGAHHLLGHFRARGTLERPVDGQAEQEPRLHRDERPRREVVLRPGHPRRPGHRLRVEPGRGRQGQRVRRLEPRRRPVARAERSRLTRHLVPKCDRRVGSGPCQSP